MQYILTVPVVYFYIWDKLYGWYAALVWTLGSFAIRIAICAWLDAGNGGNNGFASYVYTPSWTRADAYGCGMLMYMVWDYHLADKQRKLLEATREWTTYDYIVKISFWVILFGTMAFGFFYLGSPNTDWWVFSTYQYNSFSYFLWSVTLSCVIVSTPYVIRLIK
jgi:hypothetical protein